MHKPKFIIYAEGGSKTYLGHIMRCLTLAGALREQDVEVVFATSSSDAQTLLAYQGFRSILLKELNYEKLSDIATNIGASGICVDRFGFTVAQHQLLVDNVGFLVQIDDFCYDGPAQLVINATLDEKPSNRGGRWLCGGEYALIRPQFSSGQKRIADRPQDVLLTTGYGDPGNVHLKMIDLLRSRFPSLLVHIIVGGGYETKAILSAKAREDDHIILYENLSDLSEVMKRSDFAITAAGTTIYELAASGVPAIAFSLYDNQVDNINRAGRKGCIIPLGWYESINYGELQVLLEHLFYNKKMRAEMSDAGHKWIDGKGAQRVALAIVEEIA